MNEYFERREVKYISLAVSGDSVRDMTRRDSLSRFPWNNKQEA